MSEELSYYGSDNNCIVKCGEDCKHVVNNLKTLEQWCGFKFNDVLYDSDIDGKDRMQFLRKVVRQEHLYFIVIDSNNNVFGHYCNSLTDESSNDKSFIFTLYIDGMPLVNNIFNGKMSSGSTTIFKSYNETGLFKCKIEGTGYKKYYKIGGFGNDEGVIINMNNSFNEVNVNTIRDGLFSVERKKKLKQHLH